MESETIKKYPDPKDKAIQFKADFKERAVNVIHAIVFNLVKNRRCLETTYDNEITYWIICESHLKELNK